MVAMSIDMLDEQSVVMTVPMAETTAALKVLMRVDMMDETLAATTVE